MATIDDIRKGESDVLEFKRELPNQDRQMLKTIVAFANSRSGGRIIFGVDDNRQVVGIDVDSVYALKDKLVNMISEACTPQIYVDIKLELIDDRTILVAEVPHGRNTPYYLRKEGMQYGTYVRIGATTRPAEQERLEELILEGNNLSYDSVVTRDAAPAKATDVQALSKLIHSYLGDESKPVTSEQMVGWKLLQRDAEQLKPSVAFRLLTYNDVYFARIQCGAFLGKDTVTFLDKKELEGSVCEQLEQAQAFIIRHTNVGAEIKGTHRKDLYELPITALREALVNAILHRNYLLHANIRVAVFEDRVEIFSPGALYGITLDEMLKGCSSLRNPILADVFHKMGIVEKWGSGIGRMKAACRVAGVPEPSFEASDAGVTITFCRKVCNKQSFRSTVQLTKKQSLVFNYLTSHPEASYDDMVEALKMSRTAVKVHISNLKKRRVLTRDGNLRNGKWLLH